MIKKFVFCIILVMLLCTTTVASEQMMCGKAFMFFYNDVNYILKFSNPIEDLPCTSGTATLYWFDKTSSHSFSITSDGIVKVSGVGTFCYYKNQLYFLETTTVVFDEM